MAAPRYLAWLAGRIKMVAAITSSAGAADAEKIVATAAGTGVIADSLMNAATTGTGVVVKTDGVTGKLDASILPTGVGPDVKVLVASEALSAGNLVNVWDDGGTEKVRKADATAEGKEANGFVLAGVLLGGNASVYLEGTITGLAGLTRGARYALATTAGGVVLATAAPSTAGNVAQVVGVALSATELSFEPQEPITIA
jgi:hypothetical protein